MFAGAVADLQPGDGVMAAGLHGRTHARTHAHTYIHACVRVYVRVYAARVRRGWEGEASAEEKLSKDCGQPIAIILEPARDLAEQASQRIPSAIAARLFNNMWAKDVASTRYNGLDESIPTIFSI